jgi:hypothetical protein
VRLMQMRMERASWSPERLANHSVYSI